MMTTRMLFPATTTFHALDRQLDRFLDQAFAAPSASWTPALDITETEEGYTLVVDLPGVSAESLQLGVERGVLTLRGERPAPARAESVRWHRGERVHGSFVRQVTLPNHVDAGRISAALEHGVLTVTLPKAETAKARQIPVTVPTQVSVAN